MQKIDTFNKEDYDNQVQFSQPVDLRLEVNVANYAKCKPALILFCKEIVTKAKQGQPLRTTCQQFLQTVKQIQKLQERLFLQQENTQDLQKQLITNKKTFEQETQNILKLKAQLKAYQIQAEQRHIFSQQLAKRCDMRYDINNVQQLKEQIKTLSQDKNEKVKLIQEIYLDDYARNAQKNREIMTAIDKWKKYYMEYKSLYREVKELEIKVERLQNQNYNAELAFTKEYQKFRRILQNQINCKDMTKISYFPSNIVQECRNQAKVIEKVKFRLPKVQRREWIDKILCIWFCLICIYAFLFSSSSHKNADVVSVYQ